MTNECISTMVKAGRLCGNVVVALSLAAASSAMAQSDSVYLEHLTWPELQQRIAAGATTVIVPTGGTEQNGPHMALGKHNFVVAEAAGRIARELGRALVAPVISIVPEGAIDGNAGNLQFPGTLGLSEDTFERVLREVTATLIRSGFTTVCFIGDHGQSQAAQEKVAQQLTATLLSSGVRVLNVSAYYAPDMEERELLRAGIAREALGDHGGVADTAELMAVSPRAVRMEQLDLQKWTGSGPSGATGRPQLATAEIGERLLRLRVRSAVGQILAAENPRKP